MEQKHEIFKYLKKNIVQCYIFNNFAQYQLKHTNL